MIRTWEVDDANVVRATISGFGKSFVTANGINIPNRLSSRKKSECSFELANGRSAVLQIRRGLVGADVELRVDGQLMLETGKQEVKCGACSAIVKPNDRFCSACGKPAPPAEDTVHRRNVKKATNAIAILAAIFAISGPLMYFVTKSKTDAALARLAGMDPHATFPNAVNGVTYTVGALRERILWESNGVLVVNLILAVIMAGLALWSRRAPLPAVLIATATYAAVIVASAVMNPMSLIQGIYTKILIIALLYRGIKAGLALKVSDA